MAVLWVWLLTRLLGTALIILAGIYLYIRYFVYNYWQKKGVAYLEPTVPIGNIGKVIRSQVSISVLYANAYAEQKKNRYFGMYGFVKRTLVVTEPELIKIVLIKEFESFHDRGLYFNERVDPMSSNMFLLEGKKWRNLRKKCTPIFTLAKLKGMFGTVADIGERLSQVLKPKADKREVIEIKDLFARFSTDVIMTVAFGVNCNSLENPNCEFRYWGKKTFESSPFWAVLGTYAPKIMDFFSISYYPPSTSKFFTNVFNETLEYRTANNITRPDFMDLLMQLIKKGYVNEDGEEPPSIAESADGKLTHMEAVAQAYIIFVAGYETSSTTMSYCIYELACNPHIQDKVADEINATLKKFGGLTYDSLQEMTYLHKVVEETLRKYPSAASIHRVCTKDIDLPTTNLHVDKGVNIVISVLGIHRDPEIYPDPDKFDPERFNEENIASRHPCHYLPFGDGPRICIGMKMSYLMVKVGIIYMLSKYRISLVPETPIPLEFDTGTLILTSKSDICIRVEPRR